MFDGIIPGSVDDTALTLLFCFLVCGSTSSSQSWNSVADNGKKSPAYFLENTRWTFENRTDQTMI